MGGQPALAIRCRNPGEFITSVIEHHRGNRLPRNDREKTYLVFIGADNEDGVFEMIDNKEYLLVPKPNEDEFTEIVRGETDEENGHEEGEEGQGVGYGERSSEVGGEQGTQTPIVEMVGRFSRRLHPDNFTDDIYNISTMGLEDYEGEFNREEGGVKEYENKYGDQGRREVNEPSRYKATEKYLIQQLDLLQPRDSKRQYEEPNGRIKGSLDEANYVEEGLEEVNGSVKQRYLVSNKDKEWRPGEADSEEEERGSKDSEMNKKKTKYSHQYTLIKGKEARLPVIPIPDVSPISSLLSSPPEEEERGLDAEKKNNRGQGGREKIANDVEEEREEWEGGRNRDAKDYYAASKKTPQTPTRRRLLLPIREPESPVPLQPDNIPPLITPQNPYMSSRSDGGRPQEVFWRWSNNPGDELYRVEEGFQEEAGSEEEYPLYPEPVLEILVAAESVEILYISDLKGLQAFLTVLQYSPATTASDTPLLAIWGLIGAHHLTDEFGGEGIGNTLSLAIDAATRSGRFLVVGEGCIPLNERKWDDSGAQEMSWMDAEVPILNKGSMITGRTIVVKDVLGRWCRFGEDLE